MRKITHILILILILGSILISGCTQSQQGQNNSSNNTKVNNSTGNESNESPEQTIGGEQRENNANSSSGPTG